MRKRDRLNVVVHPTDAALLRTAARRLDMSLSELVRRGALRFASETAPVAASAPPAGSAEPLAAA